ncbi:BTB/POZ domain-containing protein [Ditylenchus destructor]|nr:BTB/POZ domain-containing protein [Ditylenchus destructor]
MGGINSAINSNWVCLNVGGKLFQTTKDTLSRYPESFLARLVNGDLPSEKDESGAYFVDGDPEHFRTILTYLRRGVLNLDDNEKTNKDLLCEADFYNIEPLVNEIRKAMSPANIRIESVFLYLECHDEFDDHFQITFSETQDDYEVLQALRARYKLGKFQDGEGMYYYSKPTITADIRTGIKAILRNFGFVEEFYDGNYRTGVGYHAMCWEFARTVSK